MSKRIRLLLLTLLPLVTLGLSLPAAAGALMQSYLTLDYSRASLDAPPASGPLEGDKPEIALRSAFGIDGFIFAGYRNIDVDRADPRTAGDAAALTYRARLKQKVLGIGQYWPLGTNGEFFAKLGYVRSEYALGGDYSDYRDPVTGMSGSVPASGSLCSSAAAASSYLPDFCASGSSKNYMLGMGLRYQLGSWLEFNAEVDRYRGDPYAGLADRGIEISNTEKRAGLDFLLGDASAIGLHYTRRGDLSESTLALRLRF